jgi:hypothetical protein
MDPTGDPMCPASPNQVEHKLGGVSHEVMADELCREALMTARRDRRDQLGEVRDSD